MHPAQLFIQAVSRAACGTAIPELQAHPFDELWLGAGSTLRRSTQGFPTVGGHEVPGVLRLACLVITLVQYTKSV